MSLKDEVELQYEIPPEARATELSAPKPVYWVLEVKLEQPGVDFRGTYLVPIYGPKTPSEPSETPQGAQDPESMAAPGVA